MSCNNPVPAYYSAQLNETGKRSLTFNRKYRYLGTDTNYAAALEIPCGKCLGCRADQSLMWSVRAYQESTLHPQNSFVTLTYDDDHLPPDGQINKSHLQLFFKRLRKKLSFRYIACGEYGETTRRPHYHAIIFGKDWLEQSTPIDDKLYTHPQLSDTWGNGLVSIAPVTMASICYVCGYVTKKNGDPDTFNLMSRRPGIGHEWLNRFGDDLVRTGRVVIEGREYTIPKRYLLWDENQFSDVIKERRKWASENIRSTDSRARATSQINREEIARRKLKLTRGKI